MTAPGDRQSTLIFDPHTSAMLEANLGGSVETYVVSGVTNSTDETPLGPVERRSSSPVREGSSS
jgi:hypothetical protein